MNVDYNEAMVDDASYFVWPVKPNFFSLHIRIDNLWVFPSWLQGRLFEVYPVRFLLFIPQ